MKPMAWNVKEAKDKLKTVMEYLKGEEEALVDYCGEDDDVILPEVRVMIKTLEEVMELLE